MQIQSLASPDQSLSGASLNTAPPPPTPYPLIAFFLWGYETCNYVPPETRAVISHTCLAIITEALASLSLHPAFTQPPSTSTCPFSGALTSLSWSLLLTNVSEGGWGAALTLTRLLIRYGGGRGVGGHKGEKKGNEGGQTE